MRKKTISSVHVRPAASVDALHAADLILTAGGGIFEFLLDDLVAGLDARQLLQRQFSINEMPHGYCSALVVESEGRVSAVAQYYPSSFLVLPPQKKSSLIPDERITYLLLPMYQACLPESVYLNTLSVSTAYRGQGIATLLLHVVKKHARLQQRSICLHVWADNKNAIALYEREGFFVKAHIDIKRHLRLPHDGGMLLMVYQHSTL